MARFLFLAITLLCQPLSADDGFSTIVGRATFERRTWYVSTDERLYVLKISRKNSAKMLESLETSTFKLPLITLSGYTYRTESENFMDVESVGPVVNSLKPR